MKMGAKHGLLTYLCRKTKEDMLKKSIYDFDLRKLSCNLD